MREGVNEGIGEHEKRTRELRHVRDEARKEEHHVKNGQHLSGKEARIERVCGRRTGTSEQAEQKLTGRHAEKVGGAAQEGAHLYMSAPVSSRGGGAAQDERRAGGKEHSCT